MQLTTARKSLDGAESLRRLAFGWAAAMGRLDISLNGSMIARQTNPPEELAVVVYESYCRRWSVVCA